MKRQNTIKVYDGPSMLDGKRIIVLLTGLAKSSANTKTGDMLQTWILRYDVKPNDAVKTGEDSSVCGNCPLRPFHFKPGVVSSKPCYVKTFQAPRSTWEANRDLPVTPLEAIPAIVAGRIVRRGSYGDPSAVPSNVWQAVQAQPGTGYTHQWATQNRLQNTVMASVHSAKEREQAKALGFRTFRIISDVSELGDREILCPASKEAGERIQCADCNLCDGSRAVISQQAFIDGDFPARAKLGVDFIVDWGMDKRKDVAIVAH